jgi:hypothetical protein
MRNNMRAQARRALVTTMVGGVVLGLLAGGAGAASRRPADTKIAKSGVLVIGDFPAGFTAKAPDTSSDKATAKIAKTIPECAPYRALQKLTDAQPHAKSREFEDSSRQISNEVDVFVSASAATKALALFADPNGEACLNNLFKQVLTAQLTKSQTAFTSVDVAITRQDVDPGGDESVVYEGSATVTLPDTSQQLFGIGNAAVRVGRAVNDLTYFTSSAPLADILQPLLEASLGRLQDALPA